MRKMVLTHFFDSNSVQDIINGVNKVADIILAPLNKLIDELLSKAPSFSLPGQQFSFHVMKYLK